MKKQIKSMLVMVLVLAILVGVYAISSQLPDDASSGETTTATTLPALFSAESAQVASILVSNSGGSYTLLPLPTTAADGTVTVNWAIAGNEGLPFAATTLTSVAEAALSIDVGKQIASGVTDFAPFGLDSPVATLTITLTGGEVHRIEYGSEIASGSFDYAMLDDSGTIVTVPSATSGPAKYELTDLLDKAAVVGIAEADLIGLDFARSSDSLALASTCVYSTTTTSSGSTSGQYAFTVHQPLERAGSSAVLGLLASESLALKASEFVAINPADLAVFGLDNPQYTITLHSAARTVTLKIGSQADDSHWYMISDTLPVVFTASTAAFSKLDMQLVDTLDPFVALENIATVSKIAVNLPGAAFSVDISIADGQKPGDEGVAFLLDGVDANIFSQTDASLFSAFYQRLIALSIAGIDTAATPVNTHEASIAYSIEADSENNIAAYTKMIEFVRRDDYTYYVFIDGAYAGFYIDGATAFTADKDGSEGIIVAYNKMKYAIAHAIDRVFDTEEGYQLD